MRVNRVPEWLAKAEFIYPLKGKDFRKFAEERGLILPTFVRGPGVGSEEVIRQYHHLGIKVISYISFSNRKLDPDQPKDWRFRLADAPELCIYDEKSVRERCIFADQDDPRRLDICSNTEEIVQAMLKEVRKYMEAGLDGLFIDHAFGVTKCYGEEFGIHQHIYHEEDIKGMSEEYLRFVPGEFAPNDDPLGNFAYAMLLKRAAEVMSEYGEEKIIVLNTTYWPFYYSARPLKKFVMYAPKRLRTVPDIIWENCHACMIESHVTVPERLILPDSNADVTVRWGKWENWITLAQMNEKYVKQGKRQLALSYYGKDNPREHTFYSYAIAKLSNLIWDTQADSPGGEFVTFRLGEPAGKKMVVRDDIYFRRYQDGFIAVNPSSKPSSTHIDVTEPRVKDLFADKDICAKGGKVTITLPPQSGRVYLYPY